METPLAENKPRKRQFSEEQPSGNGVKKPKVSVSGPGRAGSWQGLGRQGHLGSHQNSGSWHGEAVAWALALLALELNFGSRL